MNIDSKLGDRMVPVDEVEPGTVIHHADDRYYLVVENGNGTRGLVDLESGRVDTNCVGACKAYPRASIRLN